LTIERERQLTTSKGEERERKERLKEKAIELIDSRLSLSIQFIHSFHKIHSSSTSLLSRYCYKIQSVFENDFMKLYNKFDSCIEQHNNLLFSIRF
jgi:hypothetical protein